MKRTFASLQNSPSEGSTKKQKISPFQTPGNTELDYLQDCLKFILPRELIGMIFEYYKILWDLDKLKCQDTLALPPKSYLGCNMDVLSSTYLISSFWEYGDILSTSINLWNLKEKKIENSLPFIGLQSYIFYPPQSLIVKKCEKKN